MRDALTALALSPDDEDAQKLLLSLVVDGTGKLPEDAEREFAEGDIRVRAQGVRFGLLGYASWLLCLPLAIFLGVKSWSIPIALTALTVTCFIYGAILYAQGARSQWQSLTLAALSAAVVALSSGWLGPFVLVPVAACATGLMFIIHCTRRERPYLLGIWTAALLAPFAVEALGLVPPAYSFRGGELVLHARSILLPEGLTMAALAYTSVSFFFLLAVFVGRLRDQQRLAERHLFVQAWHLRQLFPARQDRGPAE
jgi:eukaryotic-like serine/threonine-protein kinase